ncbi:MAG: YraN family protein [Bacteroidia bacterium]|nr:YraN family protein [Bacteroidia bacterium]
MGRKGELLAAQFLRQRGYILLFQGWRKGSHEIDIIAWEGGELVFVEVRTIGGTVPWYPEQTISRHKQSGLRRAIESFLTEHPSYAALRARIDVVAIRLTEPPEIRVLCDAFR